MLIHVHRDVTIRIIYPYIKNLGHRIQTAACVFAKEKRDSAGTPAVQINQEGRFIRSLGYPVKGAEDSLCMFTILFGYFLGALNCLL